jgi:hypothetical protein
MSYGFSPFERVGCRRPFYTAKVIKNILKSPESKGAQFLRCAGKVVAKK